MGGKGGLNGKEIAWEGHGGEGSEGFCGIRVSGFEDSLDCGASGRGKNHSGMTKRHTQVLGKMLECTAKLGEGTGLRTSTKDNTIRYWDNQVPSRKNNLPRWFPCRDLKEGRKDVQSCGQACGAQPGMRGAQR